MQVSGAELVCEANEISQINPELQEFVAKLNVLKTEAEYVDVLQEKRPKGTKNAEEEKGDAATMENVPRKETASSKEEDAFRVKERKPEEYLDGVICFAIDVLCGKQKRTNQEVGIEK